MRWLPAGVVVAISATVVLAEPSAMALLDLHVAAARGYEIYRDAAHAQRLEFRSQPVFTWTNQAGEYFQNGHVFVWTHLGRPEVIGTIFSARMHVPGKRQLIHEFHTLSEKRLYPITPQGSLYQWEPEKGISIEAVEDAPAVATTPGQRLSQMRAVARTFSAETMDREKQKWELRLLPTPLLQYQPKSGEVLEGALFAMVSSAGTDPEVILMIEARRPSADNQSWQWHAAAVRFSDKDLKVTRRNKLVWSSFEDPELHVTITKDFTLLKVPSKTYTCYRSRIIDDLPDAPK